jgi:hypothetical protein
MAIDARNPDLKPDTSTDENPLGNGWDDEISDPWAFRTRAATEPPSLTRTATRLG